MAKARSKFRPALENLGSLITYRRGGADHCLGSLFVREGTAYDPEFGAVAVSPEDAATHNRLLDEALIAGLDANCAVGQGGHFYYAKAEAGHRVTTWTGLVVAEGADVTVHGAGISFVRGGRSFVGRLGRDSAEFAFTRTR